MREGGAVTDSELLAVIFAILMAGFFAYFVAMQLYAQRKFETQVRQGIGAKRMARRVRR